MTANKIIAKLLDEHKITGEEAVILIQECNKQETKIIHEYDVNKWNYPYTYPSINFDYFHLLSGHDFPCARIVAFRRMWL